MPYFLLILAASFIGYKIIPRPPVYRKSAIVITEDKKDYGQNIAAEKVKEPAGTNREPPPDKHPATLTEYMEENIKDGADKNFTKETIPQEKKPTAIDLLRAPGEKPPGPRAADWIDAEIRTLVFTGFDEPSKSITDFFKRQEYARLKKLILEDTFLKLSLTNEMYKHYILGEIEFKNGKYGEAIKYYDMAASSPTERWVAEFASFRKAESLYNMGKFEQAGEVFSGIKWGSNLLIPETEFSKAQCYLKTGKTKTASGIMEQLMSKYEGYNASDKANYCTGLILYYQGRSGEAKIFFEKAANANFEEQTLSEFYLAKCLEAEGRLLQASALFKKIHDENKKSAVADDAMFCRGMIFYRMKEYDSAAEIFLNVLRKYPAGAFAPYARFMTGCCRFETGQYRTAIANCEHFMRDS
ncbi:MAG: tetratricopeptide repeat protein, partial [bacterium]